MKDDKLVTLGIPDPDIDLFASTVFDPLLDEEFTLPFSLARNEMWVWRALCKYRILNDGRNPFSVPRSALAYLAGVKRVTLIKWLLELEKKGVVIIERPSQQERFLGRKCSYIVWYPAEIAFRGGSHGTGSSQ